MIEALRDRTYMVRHNPNCPKRFEVRLTGSGLLGFTRGDDVGFGDTADEAAANALAIGEQRAWRPKFRELWSGL